MGNTPVKFLLQHCPIELQCARILLLGCGDPRHILYTSACMNTCGGLALQQKLDITMCDNMPSIHARNIILFKLIIDGVDLNKIWMVFYSKMIDKGSSNTLQRYANDLLSLSSTLEG